MKSHLASLALAFLGVASANAYAEACDEPLINAKGERICLSRLDEPEVGNNNVSFEYRAENFSDANHVSQSHALQVGAVTPVPEPSTYALLLAGLCAVLLMGWQRRR